MLCVDTSFLFSLYHRDTNSDQAYARLAKFAQPLLISALNEYELGNAFRFSEARGLLSTGQANLCLEAFSEDQAAGRWRQSDIPLEAILTEATRLSVSHTLKGGHRAFDILHVAHACLAKPKSFLSFDTNQLSLAKSVGLRC